PSSILRWFATIQSRRWIAWRRQVPTESFFCTRQMVSLHWPWAIVPRRRSGL
ncbi:KLHL5, partial [Symbiodinium sp. CCMP2456]